MILSVDIETDALEIDKVENIWCVVCQDVTSKQVWKYRIDQAGLDIESREDLTLLLHNNTLVFHNGLGYDVPVLRRFGFGIDPARVIDTLVVSRLEDAGRTGGHSIESWGNRFRYPKGNFTGFNRYSEEMVEYCVRDVEITTKIFNKFRKFIFDPKNKKALRLEHDTAILCAELKANGFAFDKDNAMRYYDTLRDKISVIENELQELFPPVLCEKDSIQYKLKKDGTEPASVVKSREEYPLVEVRGDELVRYHYKPFSPASPIDRIDKLWEAGWKPIEKTKGHYQYLRSKDKTPEKTERYNRYGWTCSEENLDTLPPNCPDGVKRLVEWLTIDGRMKFLKTWLENVKEDGRIHGTYHGLGAWTQRKSHSEPNVANIFANWHGGEPKTPVESIKAEWDNKLRALWCVADGNWLVGTDAEGIQLRILANYMEDEDYIKAVAEGRKEDKTDVHNVNLRALGYEHLTRDDSKTFIYSYLLGAGDEKTGRTLKVSTKEGGAAKKKFLERTPALKELKEKKIPSWFNQYGGFFSLDGRLVKVPSQHHMLAGMLQAGESIVMKWAARLWNEQLKSEEVWYKAVGDIHDEWQTEVDKEESATYVGQVQRESIRQAGIDLGVKCPLAGSTNIGRNWCQTH